MADPRLRLSATPLFYLAILTARLPSPQILLLLLFLLCSLKPIISKNYSTLYQKCVTVDDPLYSTAGIATHPCVLRLAGGFMIAILRDFILPYFPVGLFRKDWQYG
jgi:hypothetical protein